MTQSMVERVAEALMRTRYRMGKPAHLQPTRTTAGGILLPVSVQQSNWDECVRDARAAIAAMREPTAKAVIWAQQAERRQYSVPQGATFRPTPAMVIVTMYSAMIDEALRDG